MRTRFLPPLCSDRQQRGLSIKCAFTGASVSLAWAPGALSPRATAARGVPPNPLRQIALIETVMLILQVMQVIILSMTNYKSSRNSDYFLIEHMQLFGIDIFGHNLSDKHFVNVKILSNLDIKKNIVCG